MNRAPEFAVTRWMTALALLPAPLWLLVALALAPAPPWRARYFASPDFQGELRELRERSINALWDVTRRVPGDGLDARSFSARWDACLALAAAHEIPFQLVSDGSARFLIDGVEQLEVQGSRVRSARGVVLRLEPGVHHLLLEFSTPGRPGVALNASLDGRAPIALGSSLESSAVKLLAPRGSDPPCGAVP